ncbi:cytohesin-interacting protein isoform X2 [Rhinatrema bivittatum]|uniref:cytohesin-interacting protein isoform X2 n=1 Tax=Rhinatrema bivittatum TaxID=194408 RepID=UPI0011280268|nr:cytohesin-interacting protein isoform X2 [Rhinatrema bivittatum]XP_029461387.1 cytohesin-interacting protein isoform X2 [Rhinatrema bivittatum]
MTKAYSGSTGTILQGHNQLALTRSSSLPDSPGPHRKPHVIFKQDNETFGFDIQTYKMHTCICKVHEDSPSHHAGLKMGDILVNINGVNTKNFSHRQMVDLIKSSGNCLRLETVNGEVIKRNELEVRLQYLKQNLREKWVELRALLLQEQRLLHGVINDDIYANTLESLESNLLRSPPPIRSAFLNKYRFSSESSCKSRFSSMTEDSEDCFYQTFASDDSTSETFSRQASVEEDCFVRKNNGASPKKTSLARSRSISMASSGSGPMSPLWDTRSVSNIFGTLPRKTKRSSIRRHLMKYIPGVHRAVEEEESDG